MKKNILAATFAAFLIFAIGLRIGRTVQAQATGIPFSIVASGPLSSCAAIVANVTQYCFPTEGPQVSLKGAAWQAIPLASVAAGVTSWNGQTGAVNYTPPSPPVLSVNGKTGVVVLTVQ